MILSEHIENDVVTLDAPGKVSGRKMDEAPDKVIFDVALRVIVVKEAYRRERRLDGIVAVSASDIPFEWLKEDVQKRIWEGLRK